ncbi:MAG: DsrE family protein [Burkholderiaceae bacterium]|nr:DsrE family protein [Burkholderiaceae bacterium]
MTFTLSNRALSLVFAAVLACAALALGLSSQVSHAQATAPAAFEDKVVYHVDDPAAMRLALGNIGNHLVASPGAKISLVANGKGITTLVAGEYSKPIAELQAKGVRFVACNNSMKGFDIEPSKLVPGAVIVPAGVAELSRLQVVEHYAYIKP